MGLRATLTGVVLASLAALPLLPAPVQADFYTYADQAGVLHITNVPKSQDYSWFMREHTTVPATLTTFSYDTIIYEASARYGVDPKLVKAVVKAESDFDVNAISPAGAKGLMQLMPDTAARMGVRDLLDPVENLDAGVRHLVRLLKRFDWQIPLALAAYNAGEGAVRKYGAVPPYSETKKYVEKVLSYYNAYKRSAK